MIARQQFLPLQPISQTNFGWQYPAEWTEVRATFPWNDETHREWYKAATDNNLKHFRFFNHRSPQDLYPRFVISTRNGLG